MAERSISVRLRADVSQYMASLKTASRETARFSDRLMSRAESAGAAFTTVGSSLTRFGMATAGALALSTKAAIDWESAWVGVQKTVDGSASEMAALEGELREMAKTLPIAHEEIAGVAAAAGQLGVRREDIADFTRTMIDLGQSTNLAAEEAATAIARFSNIMGTAHDDVDRVGSALVALGNNSATTEAEIMSMASRMAGAGALIGATESDVLAMAAALSSIGIEAEAGGGSMSRIMQQIYSAVQQGGKAVEGFARVAGTSASQFAEAFRRDPVSAINQFVQGLNRVEASGGNVVATLNEVGIRSSEDMRTVLGLKGATDLLSESLDLASTSWRENSALTEEAEQRYATAASKIQMAWNTVKDAAISVGEAIAPVVSFVAETIGSVVEGFNSLPGPVKTAVAVIGSAAAGLSLLGGAALLMLPRIAETRRAMSELGVTGANLRRGMSRTGDALARVGDSLKTHWKASLVGVGVIVADIIRQTNRLNPNIEALSAGLERFAREGELSGEAARILGQDMGDLAYAIDAVNSNSFDKAITSVAESITGLVGYAPFERAQEMIRGIDQSLSSMVESGNAQEAARVVELLAERTGKSVEEFKKALPGYTSALEVASERAKEAGTASDDAADGIDEIGVSAAESAEQVKSLVESISDLNSEFYDARAASRDYEQALDDANETIRENGANLDITTEAGRRNEAALDALAKAALQSAEATLKAAAENGNLGSVLPGVLDRIQQQKADFVSAATAAGMEREEAKKLADQLYQLPDEVVTLIQTPGAADALSTTQQLINRYNTIPRHIRTVIETVMPLAGVPMSLLRMVGGRADGGLIPGYATGGVVGFPSGGLVRGPGGPRTDSVLAAVSAGEYVVNAKATQNNLELLEAINSGEVSMAGASTTPRVSGARMIPAPSQGGGGTTIVVNAPNYLGTPQELFRAVRQEVSKSYGGDVQRAFGRG